MKMVVNVKVDEEVDKGVDNEVVEVGGEDGNKEVDEVGCVEGNEEVDKKVKN